MATSQKMGLKLKNPAKAVWDAAGVTECFNSVQKSYKNITLMLHENTAKIYLQG